MEKRGMKVSRAKTEWAYMCLNGTPLGSINMQSAQLPQLTEFRYLGSTLQSDGDMSTEVNKRTQCGWNNWRKMSGVLCDQRVPLHVNGSILNMIVQPATLYGMETVPVTSSPVKKLEVTEMKMCRWACGHTLRNHVGYENIKDRLKVERITERCRKARLRWFGLVKRRDQDCVGRQTLEMVPPGRRKRGRPKQRWMDCVNRDMRAIGTTKDEVHDRTGGRRIVSAAANPQPGWDQLEEEEDSRECQMTVCGCIVHAWRLVSQPCSAACTH